LNATPLLLALSWFAPLSTAQVPTPEEHLGRPLACDFQLADWTEVSSYYARLAETSRHVKLEKVGTTTEGRDFLVAAISSEANLARLDTIRADAARIADPRGLRGAERETVLARAKPILMISPGMHSTETAGAQFGMAFTHRLATSNEEPWRSAREELVVLMLPCTNPDGLDHVCEWYRRVVGTPYEAAGMTKLYQYYTGHDNNRDWFMVSQAETRIVTNLLYSTWHPQVYWDVHQQGGRAERIFIPPFRDPLNPNLDPGIIAGIDALCSRALLDMTREGKTGISSGVTYDMWWNGGNRNVPVRHNVIGLLTEAASVEYASPVFLRPTDLRPPGDLKSYAPSHRFLVPWPGGWWRLADIVEYEMSFGKSLLRSLAAEPRFWITNALEAAERAIAKGKTESPRAWILPPDQRDRAAVWRLVDALIVSGVEVDVAESDFRVDGRDWPAGSLVIRRDQPYGQYVKDLFETQRFPSGETPYDVAGWTLPTLLGVRRVEAHHALPAELELSRVPSAEAVLARMPPPAEGLRDYADGIHWRDAIARLGERRPVEFRFDGMEFVDDDGEPDVESSFVRLHDLPRIGVYDTWSSSMDEGWLRFVLDTIGVPFVTLKPEMLRAGDLKAEFDVIVIPSISGREIESGRAPGTVFPEYVGGIDIEGSVALERFVADGGNLVTMDASARFAIDQFELKITDAARSEKAKDFKCPGSVLRIVPATPEASRFVDGLEPSLACFFDDSTAFDCENAPPKLEVLARYAPTELLLSGYVQQPEAIEGKAAWVRCEVGKGAIHLFGFRPHFRSWTQQTFQLLLRAILFERRPERDG
jgi:hypothetical protein